MSMSSEFSAPERSSHFGQRRLSQRLQGVQDTQLDISYVEKGREGGRGTCKPVRIQKIFLEGGIIMTQSIFIESTSYGN